MFCEKGVFEVGKLLSLSCHIHRRCITLSPWLPRLGYHAQSLTFRFILDETREILKVCASYTTRSLEFASFFFFVFNSHGFILHVSVGRPSGGNGGSSQLAQFVTPSPTHHTPFASSGQLPRRRATSDRSKYGTYGYYCLPSRSI